MQQQDNEIFSESDFCNPEYHKFRLPEFSRENHESIIKSHGQKLQQQKQIFEHKSKKSSNPTQSRVSFQSSTQIVNPKSLSPLQRCSPNKIEPSWNKSFKARPFEINLKNNDVKNRANEDDGVLKSNRLS